MDRTPRPSVEAPATTWYLAEGSTSGDFSLFYLLQNANRPRRPRPSATCGRSGCRRSSGSYTLPPNSRTTIPVDAEGAELATTDVSAVITASQPIIVERAMYMTRNGPGVRGRTWVGRRDGAGHELVPRRRRHRAVLRYVHPAGEPRDQAARGERRLPAADGDDVLEELQSRRRTAASRSGSTTSSCRRGLASSRWPTSRCRARCPPPMACRSSLSGRCGGRARR